MKSTPWFKRPWFTILMLLTITPVGVLLAWLYRSWPRAVKVVLSVPLLFFWLIIVVAAAITPSPKPQIAAPAVSSSHPAVASVTASVAPSARPSVAPPASKSAVASKPAATAVPTPTPDAAKAAQAKAIQDHLGAANSFTQAGNAPAAAKEYLAILAIDPTNRVALDATADLRAYARAMAKPTDDYSTFMQEFVGQNRKASTFPSLMLDSGWKSETAVALAGLKAAGAELATPKAPAAMAHIGQLMADVHGQTDAMADDYAHGVDGMDVSLITSAVHHMDAINTDLTTAAAELRPYEAS